MHALLKVLVVTHTLIREGKGDSFSTALAGIGRYSHSEYKGKPVHLQRLQRPPGALDYDLNYKSSSMLSIKNHNGCQPVWYKITQIKQKINKMKAAAVGKTKHKPVFFFYKSKVYNRLRLGLPFNVHV